MTPLLTIAIPTIVTRTPAFARLHAHLAKQAEGKPVEIISECDNKEISIGKKRQNLLERATGEYVVYIDDDDAVSDDYVDSILAALSTCPDCVGFLIRCTSNGKNPRMAKASLKYRMWDDNVDGFSHVRSPYQKTPIRRDLALKAGFPDLRYAEDREFSKRVVPLLATEVFVDRVLYFYQFRQENFQRKYGFVRDGLAGNKRDYKGRAV